jgi:hypothetical protein
MSKACQYATNDVKLCIGMKELVSLKDAQQALQKIITWTKKFGKGWQEWDRASPLTTRKLKILMKTRFASRVVLFQKTLQYANAINICYYK